MTGSENAATTVAVDLGRTQCRVMVRAEGAGEVRHTSRGGGGLTDRDGPRRAADAVERAIAGATLEPESLGGP